jgi:uncharacterized protein YbcV (DUF1398 family)
MSILWLKTNKIASHIMNSILCVALLFIVSCALGGDLRNPAGAATSDSSAGGTNETIYPFIKQLGNATMAGASSGTETVENQSVMSSAGNVFVAGHTNGDLGEANAGSWDAFVAKFNAAGTLQWVSQLGDETMGSAANGAEEVNGIAVDSSENTYITGYTASATFGEATAGSTDAFVAKFNSAGVFQWVTRLGAVTLPTATGEQRGTGIALDSNEDPIISGYTASALVGTYGGGAYDVFIAKIDSSGTFQWVSQLNDEATEVDAIGEDRGKGIRIDSSDNIYIHGITTGSLGETYGGGPYDAFVAKFDSAGTFQWLTQLGDDTLQAGADNQEHTTDLRLTSTGDPIICGGTTSNMGEAHAGGTRDVYIAKIDSSGVFKWVKQLGNVTVGSNASGWDEAFVLAIDSADNIFLGGSTSGTMGGETNNSGGGYDTYIAKFNSSGDLVQIQMVAISFGAFISMVMGQCILAAQLTGLLETKSTAATWMFL